MKLWSKMLACACWLVCVAVAVPVRAQSMPEPNPPYLENPSPKPSQIVPLAKGQVPTVEWTYHKTADGAHPDGQEQQMLWLLNRARSNPTQEGVYLSNTGNARVASAIAYFNVDLDVMRSEFAAIAVKGPAAFDNRLYEAAYGHSLDLIARDAQDHTGQLDKVTASGFPWVSWGGNVFSYAEDPVYGHAGFNIDWGGDDGTGMQTGRGHRRNKMSSATDLTNVGIAVVAEESSATSVGPLVVTENYCKASVTSTSYNLFIVGTVWTDANSNDMYDPGEGVSGVTVKPDSGTYYAVTGEAGGYAVPADAGSYMVTFSGAGLARADFNVSVGSQSALLDYKNPAAAGAAAPAVAPMLKSLILDSGS